MPNEQDQIMINREISWLHFNERVLQEAADPRVPLIERLRFLGIFSNNLDEFFRVRVATIKRLVALKKENPAALDFDPEKILSQINLADQRQHTKFNKIYSNILAGLANENIFIVNEKELTDDQGAFVTKYFRDHVRPSLFPIMLKNFKGAGSLKDKSIYLAVELKFKDGQLKDNHALIKVPSYSLSRFLVLPKKGDRNYIILLDDVIRYNFSYLFSIFDYDTFEAYTIKLTRDAELDIDNDVSKSFMERVAESLKQRKVGRPVRFLYDSSMPGSFLSLLTAKLKISGKDTIVSGGRYHNFKDFMSFPNVGDSHLEYPETPPLPHKDLAGVKSILSVIRKKDIMLHYPYQSFQYIIDLLREASIDPSVRSIKITIYRVATNSKVVNSLINAARNGKAVTVFMELQARFDEKANIFWSQKLQEGGVKIIHGMPGIKVHSKLLLIRRRENKKDIHYAYIGTGNFNEETAKVYADDTLLTCNTKITNEVEKVFTIFQQKFYSPVVFRQLIVSPFGTRSFFTRMIKKEIANVKKGKHGEVFIKANSLADTEMIKKICDASQAGVKFRLIIRGQCVLVPGVKGISENIKAISIVDKFLEHSRVFIFHNDGDEKYYISSSDLMKRNLDHRIEVSCPIHDKEIQKELREMLEIQWKDNVKARRLDKEGLNEYRKNNEPLKIRAQAKIYNYFKEQYYQTKINF